MTTPRPLAVARHLTRRTFVAASFAVLAAACGGGDSGPTGPSNSTVNGSFTLMSAEGQSLPVSGQVGNQDVVLKSGTLTISNEQNWSLQMTLDVGTVSDQGTVTRSGNVLQFHSTRFGDTQAATVSNNNGTIVTHYDFGDGTPVSLEFRR